MISRRTAMVTAMAAGAGLMFGPGAFAQIPENGAPLVRIDIGKGASAERIRAVSEVIHHALMEAGVPAHDKFHIITRHGAGEIVYPEAGYLGMEYSQDLILIQISWGTGRSVEHKKKLYRRIADGIHALQAVRKEDIWISLVETGRT